MAEHSKYCIQTTRCAFFGMLDLGVIWDTFRASFWYPFWKTFAGVYGFGGVKASSLTFVCKTVFEA